MNQPKGDSPELIKQRARAISALAEHEGYKFLQDWLNKQIEERNAALDICSVEMVPAIRASKFAMQSIFVQMQYWIDQGLIQNKTEQAKADDRRAIDEQLAKYDKEEEEFYESLKR